MSTDFRLAQLITWKYYFLDHILMVLKMQARSEEYHILETILLKTWFK